MELDRFSTAILVLSGVVGHILFNRLEPRGSTKIVSLLLGPPTALAILRSPYSNIFVACLVSYSLYIGTLAFSVVAYRLSPFHPLAEYPGPIICKITRLWAAYIAQTGTQQHYYRSLHDRYGTHVRTGPNHLHICDAEAVSAVLGAKGFHRGARYEIATLPGTTGSLIGITDPHEHLQRRRIWDRGLNSSAVQGYQDMLADRITQLVSALEKREGEVDLSSWLSCFSFDFMGDLVFGGAFKLMEQGSDLDGYMRVSGLAARYQEVVGAFPWITAFESVVPGVEDIRSFQQFSKESVLSRKSRGSMRKDIFYYLLDEEGLGSGPPSTPQMIMEASFAIVAGSDTTGTALTNIFFYLLSNPEEFKRLQAEVDQAFPPGSDVLVPTVLGEMKFLNAVINETLRLQPAIPNGVQRVVPKSSQGALVAGRWVPAATTVQVPAHAVHRDPRYFSPDPDSFCPDRWLSPQKAGFTLNQAAFFPFSHGPMNCAGKNLAMQELRMVVCSLIQRFSFEFAPGWDPRQWEKSLSDSFILVKEGTMPVIVRVRA